MRSQRKPPRSARSRPLPTFREAIEESFDLAVPDPPEGTGVLVISGRVGDVAFVPENYQLATCNDCKQPVWISADIVEAIEARRMVVSPLCTRCVA